MLQCVLCECRLQYGLFLKGAGLSLEDASAFWQAQFTKVMTMDQFTKGYAYNVRYTPITATN